MDMEPIGISFVKPPRLTDGNFNRWKTRFENFCRSQNYQCWRVIKFGDLKVPTGKEDKEDEVLLTLTVAESDMGMVIGKHGKIARALRTVMKAAAKIADKKITVDIQ